MQTVMVETAILGSEGQHKRHHLSYVQQWQQTQAAPLLLILPTHPPVRVKAKAVWYDLQLSAESKESGSHHVWPCASVSYRAAAQAVPK